MSDLEAVIQKDPTEINLFANGVYVGEVGCIHLQRHLKATPTVQLLELKGSCICRAGAEYLSVGIKNTQLRHLGVGRNGLDHIGTNMLLKALQSTPIETLDLEWNGLQDGVAPGIAALLQVTTTLLSLSLERNDLRSEGVSEIARALCKNKSLRNLNLAWNRTGSTAAVVIGEMLQQNTTLLTLNLSQNGIPADGAKAIGIGMSRNNTLRSLNLQHNQAADAFANFVPHAGGVSGGGGGLFNASLRELNLGGNRLQIAWADRFAKNLASATRLVGLSLGGSSIGEAPMRSILTAVGSMTYLSTLDVSGCLLNSKNGPDLHLLLTRCASLGTIILDENRLEDVGMQQLAPALATCHTLTSLSVSGCEIGFDGMLALSRALKERTGLPLAELNLSNNSVDDDACTGLCTALCTDGCASLTMLNLGANGITSRSAVYLAYLLQKFSNLASITIRDNPMGRDMRASYVTTENALLLTGGFASEPPAVISAVGDANRSPGKGKGGAHNTTGAKSLPKSNFNGTSDVLASSSPISAARALALQNWEEEASYSAAAESSLSPSSLQQRQQHHADIDVALSAATAVVASERTSRNATCLHTTVSTEENVFVPGMTASVRPIKRTHELHRVEDNISAFPVTDTQLRQKFVALDKDCCGYVDPETFLKAYNELDPVSAELPDKRVTKMVEKLCPGGKIGFQEFSVMILKLVNA